MFKTRRPQPRTPAPDKKSSPAPEIRLWRGRLRGGSTAMKISLLNAKSLSRRLPALIEKHERLSLAVAWGDIMPVAESLLANTSKFDAVLFGLDFCATDPDLVLRLVDVPNAFVARNRSGCFHPKIFYFQSGAEAEAVVGSANFTKGGFGSNLEASVHVRGGADEDFFQQVREQLARYKPLHLPITSSLAEGYRRQCEIRATPRPKNPVLPGDGKDWARITSPLAAMSWSEFANAARQDVHHDFRKRLKLLRSIRQMFSNVASVADLSAAEWKGIAGVLGDAEADAANLNGLDWGWFGSMGAAGSFAELVRLRDRALAALDSIPGHGNVSEAQFDSYAKAFTAAFSRSSRTARVAPATRLLAMKRPDVFVCINGGNEVGLAEALAYAPSTLRLANYWKRVIEPIQQAPWYNTPRPTGRHRELWDGRVAMLDAIYYRP